MKILKFLLSIAMLPAEKSYQLKHPAVKRIRNSADKLNKRLDIAEERIDELEDISELLPRIQNTRKNIEKILRRVKAGIKKSKNLPNKTL
jgi:predicted  nucleic acid-binding Zn-ribbon protein